MATIQKSERSILATEPDPGDDAGPFARVQDPTRSRLRPTRALLTASLMTVLSAAGLVWTMRGESGAQLLETAPASSSTTAPAEEPVAASARSGAERGALIVDVGATGGGIDPSGGNGAGSGTTASTGPPEATTTSTTSSTTKPEAAPSTAFSAPASTAATASRGQALRTPTSAATTARSTSSSAVGSTTSASTTTASTTTAGSAGPSTTASTSSTTAPTSSTTASTSSTTGATSAGSNVAWEEHFNSLDTGRWNVEHSTYGDGNGERQCYRPGNVRVANGRLVLTARSETATCPNGSTRTVTSGMVRSRGLTFGPGQAIEFRVKLTPPDPANQAGLWPAVWASGWAGSWPRGGELDFLEVMTAEDPRRAMFSLHYADPSGKHKLQNKPVPLSGYFSDSWHTIRFDYGHNGNLAWYLDGSKVFTVSSAATMQGYPAPFDQTISEIKLNLAVGGTPGPLASGALGSSGATFEIDYVKVFAL